MNDRNTKASPRFGLLNWWRNTSPQSEAAPAAGHDDAHSHLPADESDAQGPATSAMPPTMPMAMAAIRDRPTAMNMKKGYDEIVDLMRTVRMHMEDQSRRSDRLFDLLEGLPEVIAAVPAMNEANARVLAAIQQQMELQGRTSSQLAEAVAGLSRSNHGQEKILQLIQHQLQQQNQTGEQVQQSFSMLGQSLDHLRLTQDTSAQVLREVVAQADRRDESTRELQNRSQTQFNRMVIGSWGVAGLAAVVCIALLLSFSHNNAGHQVVQSPPVAPAAEVAQVAPIAPVPQVAQVAQASSVDAPTPPVAVVATPATPAAQRAVAQSTTQTPVPATATARQVGSASASASSPAPAALTPVSDEVPSLTFTSRASRPQPASVISLEPDGRQPFASPRAIGSFDLLAGPTGSAKAATAATTSPSPEIAATVAADEAGRIDTLASDDDAAAGVQVRSAAASPAPSDLELLNADEALPNTKSQVRAE